MIELPNIEELKRITQSLATLDLIISPEWDYRFYSFDSTWSANEQMASMRDGCGDEWFLLFESSGAAAIKGLSHESPAASENGLSLRLKNAVPQELKSFSNEPAFTWEYTSFCYWRLTEESEWVEPLEQVSLETGASELLGIFVSGASGYHEFASDYYERDFDRSIIDQIFDHTALTDAMVSALNGEVVFNEIRKDLLQIGYPHKF